MLNWIIGKKLDGAERDLGVSVDHLRHILKVSRTAFFKFVKIMPLANYRRKLPADAWHLARLAATLHEDCGTCVQIELNLAKKDSVDPALLKAVLEGKLETLPPNLAAVVRFTEAVVGRKEDDEALRETIRQGYGEAGLVELALAIAVCRVFPTVKRALGYAKSCAAVRPEV